jgi:glycerophosphoryl diester phosphodiesterase
MDSLDSVRAGIRNGADAVEVDVRRNSAGELVLSHDRDESGAYRGCASLAGAFDLVLRDGRAGINCDIKETETIPAILDLAGFKGLGPDRLILTGNTAPAALREAPETVKKAWVWLDIGEIVEEYYRSGHPVLEPCSGFIGPDKQGEEILAALPSLDFLLDSLIKDCLLLGVRVLNMPDAEPLRSLISPLQERGIQASLWTLNEREPLRRAFGLGVLNITTQDTRLAAALGAERGRKP